MMKKYLLITGAILFSGICAFAQEGAPQKLSGELQDGVRVVKVVASRYKFDPDPIVVKLGEKVRIELTSADVIHGIYMPEFGLEIKASKEKSSSKEFIANIAGTFKYHCSVYCGPGHGGMEGKLIVVDEKGPSGKNN